MHVRECLCVLEIRLFKHTHPIFQSVLEVQSLKERESEEIEIRGEMSLPFFILIDATVLKWKSEVNSYIHTSALKHHNLIIDTNLQSKLHNETGTTRVQRMASTGFWDAEASVAFS